MALLLSRNARRNYSSENKIKILEREVERLRSVIKILESEIDTLSKLIDNHHEKIQALSDYCFTDKSVWKEGQC